MAQQTERGESVEKLGELIEGIEFAMLTAIAAGGTLRSRPMGTQQNKAFDGELWFFTGAGARKVADIQHDPHVNLGYADPGKQRYVSVAGTAQLARDRRKAEELWSPFLKAWFPAGLEDPDLALLRVTVEGAEYWDSPSSAVVQLVGFAKALATGQRYEGGDNERLDLERR